MREITIQRATALSGQVVREAAFPFSDGIDIGQCDFQDTVDSFIFAIPQHRLSLALSSGVGRFPRRIVHAIDTRDHRYGTGGKQGADDLDD